MRIISRISRIISAIDKGARKYHVVNSEKVVNLLMWYISKIKVHKTSFQKDKKTIYRGEIYWCYLGENIGSEESKKRPVVIVQNQKGNENAPTTIIAPITNAEINLPIAVPLNRGIGSKITGTIDLGQTKVISKGRLVGDTVDKLTTAEKKKLDFALMKSVGLYGYYKKANDKFNNKEKFSRDLNQILFSIKNELGVKSNDEIIPAIKELSK